MNMVEKMARAMKANRFCRTGRENSIATMDPPTENDLDDARAALKALLGPDDGMLDAMCGVGPDTNSGCFSRDDARAVFAAAMSHALTPQNEPREGEGEAAVRASPNPIDDMRKNR